MIDYSKVRIQEPEKVYEIRDVQVQKNIATGKWWVYLPDDSPKIFETLTLAKDYLLRHEYMRENEKLRVRKSEE